MNTPATTTRAAHTAGRTMRTDYFGRKADEAYEAFAGPFLDRTKAEYRGCKTAADLHALSRKCWKEADGASRTINRYGYDNMTAIVVQLKEQHQRADAGGCD